jgi:hypothetical protein
MKTDRERKKETNDNGQRKKRMTTDKTKKEKNDNGQKK